MDRPTIQTKERTNNIMGLASLFEYVNGRVALSMAPRGNSE